MLALWYADLAAVYGYATSISTFTNMMKIARCAQYTRGYAQMASFEAQIQIFRCIAKKERLHQRLHTPYNRWEIPRYQH